MDAGLGGSSLDWILVQSELAATTHVCVYDRAGMGWSDKRPLPRSPSQILEEVHTLLRQADIAGPYVLVAHSLAGKSARLFADSYREDVACVVLVDTRNEVVDSQISTSEAEGFNRALTLQGEVYSWARRFGVACLLGEALVDQPQLPSGIGLEMALMHTQRAAIDTTTLEGMSRSADDGAISTATLGSIPLVVVASGVSMRDIPHWSDAQEALAKLSTNARLVVAEHSGHLVQIEEPEIVIASVSDVVARARADR